VRWNAALQREVAERKRVPTKHWPWPSKTLETIKAKLAALGEMSAAVSHGIEPASGGNENLLAGGAGC